VLVSSSAVGAVGRTLQSLNALAASNLAPTATVLIGPHDDYAVEQIKLHGAIEHVFSLRAPDAFAGEAIGRCADEQRPCLEAIRQQIVANSPGDRPVTAQLVKRDRHAVWHPYTSLRDADEPLVAASAHNEFITLADGRQLIDGISSWWT